MSDRDRVFDYVVVGAGTAGCVVAARLAADSSASVAVLEAGGPAPLVLRVPLLGLWAWLRRPSRFCWTDWTVPQHELAGRRLFWPAGRSVGGSSTVNAMIYSRGHRASYDRWALGDNPGWNFDDLLPYFRRSENQERGSDEWHGVDGPLSVSDARYQNELTEAFLTGCRQAGLPITHDFNGGTAEGAGRPQVTQRNGRRATTADYLRRPEAAHVRVITKARAIRVLIDRGRATGVVYESEGTTLTVRAEREVIICSGVVRSPQVLMHSGIGPGITLRRLGLPVIVDQPSVGQNLRDHVRVPLVRRLHGQPPSRPAALARAGAQYVFHGRGALASNVCEAAAVVRLDEHTAVPLIRVVFHWHARAEAPGAFVGFEVALIDPASRGQVRPRTTDPLGPMDIDPGYLSAPPDATTLSRGVELARAIASTHACREAGIGEEHNPGHDDVAGQIRRLAESAYHPVGTCRMGTDDAAVVDTRLRVNGVGHLRVVDASVMPTTVAGNAQAAVIAIAERAADLIRSA